VKTPAKDLETMRTEAPALASQGVGLIAWKFQEPYFCSAFLLAFDAFPVAGAASPAVFTARGAEPGIAPSLVRYRGLADSGLIDKDCDHACVGAFRAGKFAYAIDGDWSVLDAAAALGSDLGLAPLPSVDGKSLTSLSATHALLFPGESLAGPGREALLEFARYLQSSEIQKRWQTEARRLPVDPAGAPRRSVSAEALDAEVAELLKPSRRVPVAESMALAWPAMRKGLKLYLAGVFSADGAAAYMQKLVDDASIVGGGAPGPAEAQP
jgi:maltose-binding protein MalE